MLLAEAIPALAQSGGLPTPINPLTVTSPGRPAYLIYTYNVRPQPWVDMHRPSALNLTFQGEVVAIIPQDVPLNHKGIVFITSHGFQSDSALEIRENDASIRRVTPLLAAGYPCFYINHGDLRRMKTEGGYPVPTAKVGWTVPEILQQLRDALCFIKYFSTWSLNGGTLPNNFPVDASQLIMSGGSSAGVLGLALHTDDGQMATMMSPLENPLPGSPTTPSPTPARPSPPWGQRAPTPPTSEAREIGPTLTFDRTHFCMRILATRRPWRHRRVRREWALPPTTSPIP